MPDQRKRSHRRRNKQQRQRDELLVFAPPGEPAPERKMMCNRSKLRIRTRRMGPAEALK